MDLSIDSKHLIKRATNTSAYLCRRFRHFRDLRTICSLERGILFHTLNGAMTIARTASLSVASFCRQIDSEVNGEGCAGSGQAPGLSEDASLQLLV